MGKARRVHDGVVTGFKGWPDSALDFYEGLEADNSRAYWNDHKHVYEGDVKAPMEALLAELASEFGESRLFRPYRDTRFSRDKSPYKTAIAARIGEGYVQFSGNGLMAGAGTYHMAPDQLDRYREAAAADRTGRKLGAVVDALRADAIEVTAMETLKTAPRGYPEGPSPDRAAAPQGSGCHEGLAGRGLARDGGGEEARRRPVPRHGPARCVARRARRAERRPSGYAVKQVIDNEP